MRVAGKPKPVTVRGVSYPSYSAAAKALGVTRQAVELADKRGRLARLGLGQFAAHRKAVAFRNDDYPEGKTFPSIKAAADELGATPMALYKARSEARLEGKKSTQTKWGHMAWLE